MTQQPHLFDEKLEMHQHRISESIIIIIVVVANNDTITNNIELLLNVKNVKF